MNQQYEIIANDGNLCGEGLLWDTEHQCLYWVDIERSLVYQRDHNNGEAKIISKDLMASAVALNRDGALVFSGSPGIHIWRGPGDYRSVAMEHEGETLLYNDMIADATGRLYAGTIYWGADGMEKPGKLYCIDTDGSVRVMDDGITLSNGLGFSPDHKTLYFADSAARTIYAYDVNVDSGDLSGRRVFVRVSESQGIPDGLTVDASGYLWCAHWYGGCVVRYDLDGTIERTIELPVKQVSNVAFGGPDMTELYITTAGEYWASPHTPTGFDPTAPMGGALYRMQMDIKGKPEYVADLN